MKTILYQPLFINPQAYFVFPQLYHIEKGDSYIEPANITGQLIISDLTKSLTLTPTINTVQDTNQVDFGLFKGKHIRISQYTNYQQNDIVIDSNNKVVYQTKNSYNGTPIYAGDKQDTDVLYIGNIRVPDNRSFVGCHGDILLFNRSLTKREISWVKNNLMCSKPQEPDIDL